MTTEAREFIEQHSNTAALMTALDAAGIESDQDWENETTIWTFDDGSKIRVSSEQIDVFGPMVNAEHIDGWAFWSWA